MPLISCKLKTYIPGLFDYFNWEQLSIEAFFSQSKVFKKLSKWKEKSLDRKPGPD